MHLAIAADTGLPTLAALTPLESVEELLRRNALRPGDDQVPEDALRRQRHRRSLVSVEMLLEEGFGRVLAV